MERAARPKPRLRPGFEVKRRNVGRPRGRRPFLEDPARFTMALAIAAEIGLGLDKHAAAGLALILVSDEQLKAHSVDEVLLVMSTSTGGMASMRSRIGALARKIECTQLGLVEADWLLSSAVLLRLLAHSYLRDDDQRRELRFTYVGALCDLGWRETLKRIAARIEDALAANLSPTNEEPRRKARALLARLRDQRLRGEHD